MGITHGFITRCCKSKALKAQEFIFLYEHDADSITNRVSQLSDTQPLSIQDEVWKDEWLTENNYKLNEL